jgi:hypothetical protein
MLCNLSTMQGRAGGVFTFWSAASCLAFPIAAAAAARSSSVGGFWGPEPGTANQAGRSAGGASAGWFASPSGAWTARRWAGSAAAQYVVHPSDGDGGPLSGPRWLCLGDKPLGIHPNYVTFQEGWASWLYRGGHHTHTPWLACSPPMPLS